MGYVLRIRPFIFRLVDSPHLKTTLTERLAWTDPKRSHRISVSVEQDYDLNEQDRGESEKAPEVELLRGGPGARHGFKVG